MKLFKGLPPLNVLHRIIAWFIRMTLVVAGIGAVFERSWLVLFVVLLTLFLTWLPLLIERNYRIHLPVEFEIAIVLFVYATLFLGDIHGYYTRFWWWDIVLHAGSAMAFGLAGFIVMYMLYKGRKIHAKPITVALFTFCFALAIGAVWEIFEFAMDQIVGTNMQKSGLIDTMLDLIVDAVGGFLASVMGFLYLKRRKPPVFERALQAFIDENPRLFK